VLGREDAIGIAPCRGNAPKTPALAVQSEPTASRRRRTGPSVRPYLRRPEHVIKNDPRTQGSKARTPEVKGSQVQIPASLWWAALSPEFGGLSAWPAADTPSLRALWPSLSFSNLVLTTEPSARSLLAGACPSGRRRAKVGTIRAGIRGLTPSSRPSGRCAVGLRPSLDHVAYIGRASKGCRRTTRKAGPHS